jgi:hypothetical protein
MYKCPKCHGTDVYRGKKQVEYGYGLMRHSREELRSFCRRCDIEAIDHSTGFDWDKAWLWIGMGVFLVGATLFLYWLVY